MRAYLRGLPVFAGELPQFERTGVTTPELLFADWLTTAVEAGVREPHAMTLSTVGADGVPDARVLILKNADRDGWQFALHGGSPKGRQLKEHPAAALTFYWPDLARQVRVRGPVAAASAEDSAADFRARPPASQAEARLGRQSEPRTSEAVKPLEWTLCTLRATSVEFWQGRQDRRHVRLRFARTGDGGWRTEELWP